MGTVGVIAGAIRTRSAPRRPRESARVRAMLARRWVWRAGRCCARHAAGVGAQPDGPERVDPQVPRAVRLPEGDLVSAWRRHLEVGRFRRCCGSVRKQEGLVRTCRSSTCWSFDRRSACRRPCRWRRSASRQRKHVLAVVEGATENTVLPGLARQSPRQVGSMRRWGFIVDGAKALSKGSATPGVAAAIQRCQAPQGRNGIIDACPCICMRASRRRSVRPGQ